MFHKFIVVLSLGVYISSLSAQSPNWEDYGLSEESVKELSQETKQNILRSKTPKQTEEYLKQQIQKKGIDIVRSESPFPISSLLADDQGGPSLSPEIVSCFDYYTFGSIETDITASTSSVVSGTRMNFTGTVTNTNPYPVVQGTLYVKIFKNIGVEKNPNGPDVVDQFVVAENLTIPANASIPVAFSWKVPAYATSGEYRVGTYFVSDEKYNLSGLSFTDDIVGNFFAFTVSGEQRKSVMFDKASVVINDNPYFFAAYPPRITKGENADITVSVTNDTTTDQDAQIAWELYTWDSMQESNLIRSFITQDQIPANSQKQLSFSLPEDTEPVYLLIGTLTYQDTKSIVNIRYVRDEVDKVRLNYPAVMSYPLTKDTPATLFTCLHNSGQSPQVENNRVVLEIKDKQGNIVESYTYSGIVTGDMMAVKKDFIPRSTLDSFTVHASLYHDDILVDESTMIYDCQTIDPSQCQEAMKAETEAETKKYPLSFYFILGGGLLLFILGTFYFIRHKKTTPTILILLAILCLGAVPIHTEAKSVSWNETVNKTFTYFWNRWHGSGWDKALTNPNINITYNVEVTNEDTKESINSGDNVAVGTRVKFNFLKHKNVDISWVGTGYSADSPYGEWKEEGFDPPKEDTCKTKDFVVEVTYPLLIGVYIPLVIDSPNKSIKRDDESVAKLSDCETNNATEINGISKICTVSSAGKLKIEFNFSATKGKFYYRYWDFRDGTAADGKPAGCFGNNIALRVGKSGEDYIVQIPAKKIQYTLNAFVPNSAPSAPTITGDKTGYVNTSYTFGFQASDPDGDTIRYGIDWDKNGSVDEWFPSSGYVASNTKKNSSKTWTTIGGKTFQAIAEDKSGARSGWATHTITLSYPPITASCVPSSTGQTIAWKVTASGGTGAYTYKWTGAGTDIFTGTGTTNPLNKTYITFGEKKATVVVTSGTQSKTITCASTLVSGNSCSTRMPVDNSIACNDGTPATSSDQDGLLVASCSNTVSCDWECDAGYYKNGAICSPNICTGTTPTYADLCDVLGDTGLLTNTARTLTDTCSSTNKCEYECNSLSTYDPDTNTCILNVIPTVTSPTATDVTSSSATLGAHVTSVGVPSPLTLRGVCWSTKKDPSVDDDGGGAETGTECQSDGIPTIGVFTVPALTGLDPLQTYHYRGYAINATGTAYTEDKTFQTSILPTGSIEAPGCEIEANKNTCETPLTWSTTNLTPRVDVIVATDSNPSVSKVPQNPESFVSTIFYGDTIFYLRHNGEVLSSVTTTAKCEARTQWDSILKICEAREFVCNESENPIENAIICPGSENNLIKDGVKSLVGECNPNNKCEFKCDAGYSLKDGVCQSRTSISGVCGTAKDTSTSTIPTTNLCFKGTASPVTGVGPWNWTCTSTDNTKTPCSASNIPVTLSAIEGCFADGSSMNPVPKIDTYSSNLSTRVGRGNYGYMLTDSDRILQNQTLLTRLAQNTTTFITNQYSPTTPIPGNITFSSTPAAVIRGGNTSNKSGYYYYRSTTGGAIIIDSQSITGQKVLLVEGLDVQINGDIKYADGSSSLVIIVKKNGSEGGNIYVNPGVKNINATLIADGALLNGTRATTKDWVNSSSIELKTPLVINGRLLTHNTRGGSLEISDNTFVKVGGQGQCGGILNTSPCSITNSAAQDLERFRLTSNTSGQCTLYVTGMHPFIVPVLVGIID